MNQAKIGLVETNLKLSPLKVGHNWTTQKPKLDFDCLHEFVATTGHKNNPNNRISFYACSNGYWGCMEINTAGN